MLYVVCSCGLWFPAHAGIWICMKLNFAMLIRWQGNSGSGMFVCVCVLRWIWMNMIYCTHTFDSQNVMHLDGLHTTNTLFFGIIFTKLEPKQWSWYYLICSTKCITNIRQYFDMENVEPKSVFLTFSVPKLSFNCCHLRSVISFKHTIHKMEMIQICSPVFCSTLPHKNTQQAHVKYEYSSTIASHIRLHTKNYRHYTTSTLQNSPSAFAKGNAKRTGGKYTRKLIRHETEKKYQSHLCASCRIHDSIYFRRVQATTDMNMFINAYTCICVCLFLRTT